MLLLPFHLFHVLPALYPCCSTLVLHNLLPAPITLDDNHLLYTELRALPVPACPLPLMTVCPLYP